MNIRDIKIDDYKRVAELNKQLGYEYPPELVKLKIGEIIKKGTDKILVAADESDLPVGYIHASSYELLYFDNLVNILGLVVDEKCREKGVGKKLVIKIEEWAKTLNYKGVRLVSNFNRPEAHEFYKKCGYNNKKDQKHFIKMFE
jgi:GNAT superfamily N-acetyltransferase